MNAQQFVAKWKEIELSEIAVAQSHFIDVCSLVGHPAPTDIDAKGEFFTFEIRAEKPHGQFGRADAWYKDRFIWEYKRPGSDLDKAYDQLLLYRESLGNPPLLITSDIHNIVIHTNFTNTAKKVYLLDFARLLEGDGVAILKQAFHQPDVLKPDQSQEQVTKATADTFVQVANSIQQWAVQQGGTPQSERLSHFTIRLLFSLFAQDMGLLPKGLVTEIVHAYKRGTTSELNEFVGSLRRLFASMRDGGFFGTHRINHFNGGLFEDDFVPDLPTDILSSLNQACLQNWANIDPSIFGTLFERIIDEAKRSLLGLHYTSKQDIMLIVEPVIMDPLRKQWATVKQVTRDFLRDNNKEQAYSSLKNFCEHLATLRILDPACGSGNFLYVSLQQLLDLQKEVITFAAQSGLSPLPLSVGPSQLYGIETNPYAYELAQVTVWIGYLQWRFENGFREISEPILHALDNIQHRDAILSMNDDGPSEPEWPQADFIVGNPPFLGSRKMRPELGDAYCDNLLKVYAKRLQGQPDLVCYWFEKAAKLLADGRANRVGLLATQAIRGGTNRQVLQRIKDTGDIFFAWSDREWILDGATVHVSMVGFDSGEDTGRILDGNRVSSINSDLTSGTDISNAPQLAENIGISFQGVILRGPFDIQAAQAKRMLSANNNPNGKPNADVIKVRKTGRDVLHSAPDSFVVDFGLDASLEEASQYLLPFEHVRELVLPMRKDTKQANSVANWWLHWNARPEMRKALSGLKRYIATPRVAKHRVFVWLDGNVLPDAQLVVFARSDDYFFGVLHSRPHELWARRAGTQLRDAESGFRYTPTTTFQTYPMPWPPNQELIETPDSYRQISETSRILHEFRERFLHPEGVGITFSERVAKQRNLNALYNALDLYRQTVKGKTHNPAQWNREVNSIISLDEIEEFDYIHQRLDTAVLTAYGWPGLTSDDEIIARLLALNGDRAARTGRLQPSGDPNDEH